MSLKHLNLHVILFYHFKPRVCVSQCDILATLPVYEAVQQLFATAVLCHQHQVAWCDVGLMQSHDLLIMKRFQDLILLQNLLLVLLVVRNDLCDVDFARRVLPALANDSKTTPGNRS